MALPKVVTAQFISDPLKTTVCVYGHVDVQPGKLEDGWATEQKPFAQGPAATNVVQL